MVSKSRIEKVLGATITNEQVDQVCEFYSEFAENPEMFANDPLIDFIREDLNIKVNVKSMIDKLADKYKKFSDYGYVGGLYDENFFAIHTVHDPNEIELIMGMLQAIEDDKLDPKYDIVGSFYDTGDSLIIKVSESKNGIVPATPECEGFRFLGTYSLRNRILAQYIIPYNKTSNSVTPIIWKVCESEEETRTHLAQAIDLTEVCENVFNRRSAFTAYSMADEVMHILEEKSPHSESDADRFVYFKIYDVLFCYNTRHVAYNGRVSNVKGMIPIFDVLVMNMHLDTEFYSVIGTEDNDILDNVWFYGDGADADNTQNPSTNHEGEFMNPPMSDDYSNNLEKSNAKTPLGKMLDRATGKYE